MADLDFSELDKAVNEVMSGARKPANDAAPTTSQPAAQPAIMPAVKRQAKFMDIIRPTATAPVSTVKRQGATIQPRTQTVASAMSDSPSPDPVQAPAAPLPVSVDPKMAPSFGIDMALSSETEGPTDTPETALATPDIAPVPDIAAPNPDVATIDTPDGAVDEPKDELSPEVIATPLSAIKPEPEAPLVSPFLPNVDVEKRPLGGFAAEQKTEEQAESTATMVNEVPDTTPTADANESTSTADDNMAAALVELNREHPEQLSEPSSQGAASVELKVAEVATSTDEKAPEPEIASAEKSSNLPAPGTDSMPTVPAGGSIAQQYTEKPSTSNQTNGAIYDTKTYNQPIKALPAKKKKASIAIWILWVIALVLIGGIAAAAYFYFQHQ